MMLWYGEGSGGYEIVNSDNEDMGTYTGDVEHERQVVESWAHEKSGTGVSPAKS